MKVLHGLFLLFALSLTLVSCDSGSAEKEATVSQASTTPGPEEMSTQQVESIDATKKAALAAQGIETSGFTKVVPGPIDDADINYKKLAGAMCDCGSAVKGTAHTESGYVHVKNDDTSFQKEVDCAVKAKNEMSTGDIDRNKLAATLKEVCSDLPPKLIMRVLMSLAK